MALTVVLGMTLLGLWLVLSGHYDARLVSLGVVSTLLVTWAARRMKIVDSDSVPVHLFFGVVGYWAWLIKEMFVANVQVARIVLSRRPRIDPGLVDFRGTQRTDLGRVIYANSITLTPGTITVDADGADLRVHALAWSFVDGHEEGEMDERVTGLEAREG